MMRIAVLSMMILCLSVSSASAKFGNAYVARIKSVYDGDTFRVDIADWPAIVGQNIAVRVSGVDTPEIRGKCASEKALAQKAKQFVLDSFKGAEYVELRNIQRGKYFRLVAEVYIDGESLTDALLSNGLAYPYDGGTKRTWC